MDDPELVALRAVRVSLQGVSVLLGAMKRDMNSAARELDLLAAHNANWSRVFGLDAATAAAEPPARAANDVGVNGGVAAVGGATSSAASAGVFSSLPLSSRV